MMVIIIVIFSKEDNSLFLIPNNSIRTGQALIDDSDQFVYIGMFRLFPSALKQARRVNVPRRCLATVADTRETMFKIPIVDFGSFLNGNEREKNETAKEILDGFTSSGFIYLGNTGLSKDSVSNVFSWSKKFFKLPTEEKLKLAWETPESNRGYVAPGREKVSRLLNQEEIEKIRAASPD